MSLEIKTHLQNLSNEMGCVETELSTWLPSSGLTAAMKRLTMCYSKPSTG